MKKMLKPYKLRGAVDYRFKQDAEGRIQQNLPTFDWRKAGYCTTALSLSQTSQFMRLAH